MARPSLNLLGQKLQIASSVTPVFPGTSPTESAGELDVFCLIGAPEVQESRSAEPRLRLLGLPSIHCRQSPQRQEQNTPRWDEMRTSHFASAEVLAPTITPQKEAPKVEELKTPVGSKNNPTVRLGDMA